LFRDLLGRPRRAALAALFNRANIVHALTMDSAENLTTHLPGLRPTRIRVIESGIDVDRFTSPSSEPDPAWRVRQGVPAAPCFVFGFVGRPMPEKGMGQLIQAVNQLVSDGVGQQFVVVVVGGGGFMREYVKQITALSLQAQFRFLGYQPDIAETLKHLGAVVIPSLRETGPLLPMEALVSGCPVLASTCIGLREVTAGTPAATFAPGSGSALASVMRATIEGADDLRHRTTLFRETARRRFDARTTAIKLDHLFSELRAVRTGER
jgi:glycosyltransferase involved in cell wall biosynthesis